MMEFSADYPGCWERAVEQATGGMAGVPRRRGGQSLAGATSERVLAGPSKWGRPSRECLLERLPADPADRLQVAFGMIGLDVTMPPLNARLSDGVRFDPGWPKSCRPEATASCRSSALTTPFWISTPCDLQRRELALGIKDFLRARGSSAHHHQLQRGLCRLRDSVPLLSPDGYEPRLMSFFRAQRAGLLRRANSQPGADDRWAKVRQDLTPSSIEGSHRPMEPIRPAPCNSASTRYLPGPGGGHSTAGPLAGDRRAILDTVKRQGNGDLGVQARCQEEPSPQPITVRVVPSAANQRKPELSAIMSNPTKPARPVSASRTAGSVNSRART